MIKRRRGFAPRRSPGTISANYESQVIANYESHKNTRKIQHFLQCGGHTPTM
jgi:hypothetical protein